jgi:hypothetical protein
MLRAMTPRRAVFVALAGLAACKGAGQPQPLAHPNVLMIVIDCLRADHLSASGYARPTTPNLDALAREGVTSRTPSRRPPGRARRCRRSFPGSIRRSTRCRSSTAARATR